MNNWPFLVPSLVFGVFGVAGVVYGVWQRQNARSEILLSTAKDYQALREVYEGDVAQLRIAEEELERKDEEIMRMAEQSKQFKDQRDKLNLAFDLETTKERFLVETLSARNNEITTLRERGLTQARQLSESQAEIERLNEAAHPALLVEEEASNEAQTPMATNNTKPVRTHKRQRTTTEGTGDHRIGDDTTSRA
jgi:hypothetical protein